MSVGILMRHAIELITLHQMNKSWLHLHVGGIDGWPNNTVEVDMACECCIIFQSASFTTSTITMRIVCHFFFWKRIKILKQMSDGQLVVLELVFSLLHYCFCGQFSLSRDQQGVVLKMQSSLYGSYPA